VPRPLPMTAGNLVYDGRSTRLTGCGPMTRDHCEPLVNGAVSFRYTASPATPIQPER
jgi:hypothetical protein